MLTADRLYFACLRTRPKNTAQKFYFCIDDELVYLKFVGVLRAACALDAAAYFPK